MTSRIILLNQRPSQLIAAFEKANSTMSKSRLTIDPDLDGNEILEGIVYSWLELELVEKGTK